MPDNNRLKIAYVLFMVLTFSATLSSARDVQPTICRSQPDEDRFRSLAEGKVDIIAVCPKKGLYFLEIVGAESDVNEFKDRIRRSDLKVTNITEWRSITETGSKVLLVEFEY